MCQCFTETLNSKIRERDNLISAALGSDNVKAYSAHLSQARRAEHTDRCRRKIDETPPHEDLAGFRHLEKALSKEAFKVIRHPRIKIMEAMSTGIVGVLLELESATEASQIHRLLVQIEFYSGSMGVKGDSKPSRAAAQDLQSLHEVSYSPQIARC